MRNFGSRRAVMAATAALVVVGGTGGGRGLGQQVRHYGFLDTVGQHLAVSP